MNLLGDLAVDWIVVLKLIISKYFVNTMLTEWGQVARIFNMVINLQIHKRLKIS
jgi:hypothetical protein